MLQVRGLVSNKMSHWYSSQRGSIMERRQKDQWGTASPAAPVRIRVWRRTADKYSYGTVLSQQLTFRDSGHVFCGQSSSTADLTAWCADIPFRDAARTVLDVNSSRPALICSDMQVCTHQFDGMVSISPPCQFRSPLPALNLPSHSIEELGTSSISSPSAGCSRRRLKKGQGTRCSAPKLKPKMTQDGAKDESWMGWLRVWLASTF